jgi:hypothetical protein
MGDLLGDYDISLAGQVLAAPETRGPLRQMGESLGILEMHQKYLWAEERPHFPPLHLTRSSDSSAPSTPKSSYITNLPAESPTSPLAPRSSSPAGRATPVSSRPPSQLRNRDSRPPYLPFRRISLPSVPNQKRDSIASIFSVDSVQEHDEDNVSPTHGKVSASLPTESSMPDMGLPPPPPIPAARTPLSSSPSRRVVAFAPSTGGVSATPSRVRPRPVSTPSVPRASPVRLLQPGRSNRRLTASKAIVGEKEREREERRRQVAKELLDTEQTYVDGLDLVYHVSPPCEWLILVRGLTSKL